MKCPHCSVEFHTDPKGKQLDGLRTEHNWSIAYQSCPSCSNLLVHLAEWDHCPTYEKPEGKTVLRAFLAYPSAQKRTVSADVPAHIAKDYQEASAVVGISPKASAALSRRCLELILVDCAGAPKNGTLEEKIDRVVTNLPSSLSELIHGVRMVGNYAAHPTRYQVSGEIVEVEPGEAELLMDLVGELIDYYIEAPARRKHQKEALNKKLTEAGKKTI